VREEGVNTPTDSDLRIFTEKNETSNNNMMRVVHTPLLGPQCAQTIQCKVRHTDNQRAGFNVLKLPDEGVHDGADMEKMLKSHGSPKVLVTLDKTPTMMNDRLEMFGDIRTMIKHWEGLEEKENEKEVLDPEMVGEGGKTKRMSEVVQRLSGIFEGEEMAKSDTSESGCNKGEGGDRNISFIDGVHSKVGYEGSETKKNNACSAKLSSFSNPKLSTNEKPGITISCIQSVSTNRRAGIYETKEDGRSIAPVRLPGNQ
jgi:CDGSH-type Zn-finger protein